MKLKQSDRRGFSARSTGALDTKSLPTRSFKSKSHLERHSSSCIKFRKLNPYIVRYKINLVNCWEILLKDNQQPSFYYIEEGSTTIESIVMEKDHNEEVSRVHQKSDGSAQHFIFGNRI